MLMNKKLLSLFSLKFNPFSPEVPSSALWLSPATESFCWRIDVLPRLTHLAGLELSTGLSLNIVAPEHAAAELRAA